MTPQSPSARSAAGVRARRVDHHAGTEFVVLPQIAVDVARQHQVDDGAPRAVLADLQAAVVDKSLSRSGIHREHRGVNVRLTNLHRHGEHCSGDGVL